MVVNMYYDVVERISRRSSRLWYFSVCINI